MSSIRAKAEVRSWSGHGEGGSIVSVIITGRDYGIYDSDPPQIAQAEKDAAAINMAIDSLAGLISAHDAVTDGLERERRDEWMPKARAALAALAISDPAGEKS